MKNLLLTAILLFTFSLTAQTHQMVKHDGQTIDVNFIKTENNLVYYTFPQSTEEQLISVYAIAQLTDKSKNTTVNVSEKINMNSKSAYKNVIVLQKNQTFGLKESGVITSFYGGTKGETPLSFTTNGERRLKQNAALKGSPFIVILSNAPRDLKAVIYSY